MTPDVKNKKTQILEAAAILFRDKGYSATSMRDLASVVDLKASSLYNHIKSKQEILREICFDNANRFIQEMNKVEAMDIMVDKKLKTLLAIGGWNHASEGFTQMVETWASRRYFIVGG